MLPMFSNISIKHYIHKQFVIFQMLPNFSNISINALFFQILAPVSLLHESAQIRSRKYCIIFNISKSVV